jgi:adenosylcobinamide-GDP ribazoletransferase
MALEGETFDEVKEQVRGWVYDLGLAVTFLTRLPFPMPDRDLKPGDLSRAMRTYPIVGAGVGLGAGLVLMAASDLNLAPLACAMLGLAAAALLTGALHEDGLADTVDGFAGGRTRAEKLKIMRDSHIGAFGVLALVFSVGIRAAILSGVPGPGTALLVLIASGALSRAPLAVIAIRLDPARKDGLSGTLGRPQPGHVITGAILATLISFLALGFLEGGAVAILWALLGVAVATGLMAWIAIRQIEGHTGDVMGAVQQVSEIAALIAIGSILAW